MDGKAAVCPKCEQADLVRKVSGMHAMGTGQAALVGTTVGAGLSSAGHVSVGTAHTRLDGDLSTSLGKALAPPERYKRQAFSGFLVALAVFLLVVGPCMGLLYAATGADMVFTGVFLAGFGILGGVRTLWERRRHLHKEDAKAAEREEPWNLAMARWNRLYYCVRDDVVFDPEEQLLISVGEVQRYVRSGCRTDT
ncbi:MAG: hypothetical protein E3J64_06160 [Anaerolineales bacterium]|nr:MAG: hypothetical protein E3J64_06160 [Anaerolineales bacterium]